MDQFTTSVIRTVTPVAAGALITWGVRQGVPVDQGFAQPLTEALTAVFTAGYYLAARVLETEVAPKFGWMLGVPKPPAYPAPAPPPGPGTYGTPVTVTDLTVQTNSGAESPAAGPEAPDVSQDPAGPSVPPAAGSGPVAP